MNPKYDPINPIAYQQLFKLGKHLLKEKDMNKLLSRALNTTLEISGAERGCLMLFNTNERDNQFWIAKHLDKKEFDHTSFEFSRMIMEKVKTEGTPMYLPNTAVDPHQKKGKNLKAHNPLSVICLPLIQDKHVFGILYLDHHQENELFTQEVFSLIKEYIRFISTAAYTLLEEKQLKNLVSNLQKTIGGKR